MQFPENQTKHCTSVLPLNIVVPACVCAVQIVCADFGSKIICNNYVGKAEGGDRVD